MSGVWREPGEESVDLYPGLVVCDDRVTGSITAGRSRLPLWAFTGCAVVHGWAEAEAGYSPSDYDMTAESLGAFLYNLLELRGEFGRLILMLANAERLERERDSWDDPAWWETPEITGPIVDQLRRCLAKLEES